MSFLSLHLYIEFARFRLNFSHQSKLGFCGWWTFSQLGSMADHSQEKRNGRVHLCSAFVPAGYCCITLAASWYTVT